MRDICMTNLYCRIALSYVCISGLHEKMEKRNPVVESHYDTRTVIFRTIVVVCYICFGSGIFHLLERNEASNDATNFEASYNKTMSSILCRGISNETKMQIIMAEIRRTFLQESFPTEWNFLGGVNISVQAITTIG